MNVGDAMKTDIETIQAKSTFLEAASIFSQSHASDLMVVDEEQKFLGVLSEGDLIRRALPDFQEMLSQGQGMSGGLDAFLERGQEMADESIDTLVIHAPISMTSNMPLIKAATVMTAKQIRRLPVVDDGQLVGVISRSDVCWALLTGNKTPGRNDSGAGG